MCAVEQLLSSSLLLIALLTTATVLQCAAAPRYEHSEKEGVPKNDGDATTNVDVMDYGHLLDLDNATDYQNDGQIVRQIMEEPRLRMLYSRTGYHLQLLSNGAVTGTNSGSDKFAFLQIISVRPPSIVAIKGVYSGKYLAMNKKGVLYATGRCLITQKKSRNCHFSEGMDLSQRYNTYSSVKYPPPRPKGKSRKKKSRRRKASKYYVALDSRGHPMEGPDTRLEKEHVLFLPRLVRDEAAMNAARTYLSQDTTE
ncbi:fibroblast growth factor 9-like [Glandiceps talaboti]